MKRNNSWIIFDADNTLWLVEHLYDAAREQLCRFLTKAGHDLETARAFQEHRDRQLHATYGYSACRFARSFEDTLLHFIPDSPPEAVRHVRQLALNVFEATAGPVDGLAEVLPALAKQYRLGIITAGERWVQERRLSAFHLRSSFDATEIVERKTAAVFADFCMRHRADIAASWVVGDSMNSDIVPAREAGLRTVLIRTKNWALVEGDGTSLGDHDPAIATFRELLDVPGLLRA